MVDAKGCSSFLGNAVLFNLEDDFIKAKEIIANLGFTEQETDHWFNDKVKLHVFCKRLPDNVCQEMYISCDGTNPYKFANMLNVLQYNWVGIPKPNVESQVNEPQQTQSVKTESVQVINNVSENTTDDNGILTEEEKVQLEEIEKEEAEEAKHPETADEPKETDEKYLSDEECWWIYFDEAKNEKGEVILESKFPIPPSGKEIISETITKEYVYRNGKLTMKFRTNKPGYKIVRDGATVKEIAMSPEEKRKRKLAAIKSKYKRRAKKTTLFRKRKASIKKHKSYLGYKPYKKRK